VALLVRTADASVADRLPGLAAELAFWVLLSAPALLLTAIATLSLVAGEGSRWQDQLVDRIVEVSSVALTRQALDNVIRPLLEQLIEGTNLSVVSLAFLATIWTASRAVKVVLVTIALTYGEQSPRGAGQRVLGIVLTLTGLVVGLVLAPLLIAGPNFGERLGDLGFGNGDVVAAAWRALYWPGVTIVATAVLASLYHVGAPWPTRWLRDLPGAVLATTVWLAGSGALRLYGTWILGTDSVYGPLAGPLVGLLWLWLTGFAVLLGAQLNAQIEHLWPTRTVDGDGPEPSALRRLATSTTGRLTFDPRDLRRDRPPSAGGS
jgi:membrane protein